MPRPGPQTRRELNKAPDPGPGTEPTRELTRDLARELTPDLARELTPDLARELTPDLAREL
ncbi:MAG TPA: hypothetical protein VN712_07090, partial [Dermatophilaceae bacterium]|nr:hypothetical protein [Dermatophilaceae bacterium]